MWRNEALIEKVDDRESVQKLIRFSQEFYTVENWTDTLVFNDLRFGQIIGWQSPRERFAFHFFVDRRFDNRLVVQRGRFAKWDWDVAKRFVRRIKGER